MVMCYIYSTTNHTVQEKYSTEVVIWMPLCRISWINMGQRHNLTQNAIKLNETVKHTRRKEIKKGQTMFIPNIVPTCQPKCITKFLASIQYAYNFVELMTQSSNYLTFKPTTEKVIQ
jgi:hypothetical protein